MFGGSGWCKALTVAVAGLSALALTEPLGAVEAKRQPNVLIITTDQQRVDAMSAVGNRWARTPNMDSLAAKGIYFTRSYCSYPLCSPARSSLHTGRTPHEIGVDRNSVPIDSAVPLSGQVFRSAGFDTGYAGKWHMPDPYPNDGIAGFEVLNKTSRKGKLAHDVDEATKDSAVEFLQRKRDKPFFLVTSFINPHDICLLAGGTSPLVDEVWKKYGPTAGAELPPLPSNFGRASGKAEPAALRLHPDWDETHWRKYRYAYFRMIEDVDRQVGQVLKALRNTGQEENTVVIFTSDHGEGLGSRHWTGKMMFFEEEAAVPLIVSWSGVTPAGRIDREHLVSTLDVLPTLCDYARVPPPPLLRGQSLRAVIEKPEQPGHDFVVSEMANARQDAPGRSFLVRTKKYKYLVFPAAGGKRVESLFDLETDPLEVNDLAGEPALAGELRRHRHLLTAWKESTEEDKHPPKAAPEKKRRARQR